MLEELDIPYEAVAIDITKGDQHTPEFLAVNPNNKIPALVDGETVVYESGAILLYLAEKTGRFAPKAGTETYWKMMEWLMWQMSGFGPMLGQAHHFLHYHPGKSDYSEKRYHDEAKRLYGVLDTHLAKSAFLLDALSVADFATWPWVARFGYHQIDLNAFPSVCEWYLRLAERPGFQRGYVQPVDAGAIPKP